MSGASDASTRAAPPRLTSHTPRFCPCPLHLVSAIRPESFSRNYQSWRPCRAARRLPIRRSAPQLAIKFAPGSRRGGPRSPRRVSWCCHPAPSSSADRHPPASPAVRPPIARPRPEDVHLINQQRMLVITRRTQHVPIVDIHSTSSRGVSGRSAGSRRPHAEKSRPKSQPRWPNAEWHGDDRRKAATYASGAVEGDLVVVGADPPLTTCLLPARCRARDCQRRDARRVPKAGCRRVDHQSFSRRVERQRFIGAGAFAGRRACNCPSAWVSIAPTRRAPARPCGARAHSGPRI